jgi:hypothetical protein
MTRRSLLLVLVALLVATSVQPLVAHPGHEHKLLGTVTMVGPDHIMLKTRDGKEVTVHTNAETKVTKGKQPATLADVKDGTRVFVVAVTPKEKGVEKMIARTIEVGVAGAAR